MLREFQIPNADSRHPNDLFDQFANRKNNLITKKIFYYPTEFFTTYKFVDRKFAEMYLDNLLYLKNNNF
jgi:hypothetical protein